MDINYGEREESIVRAGIHEIQDVLFGSDTKAKERLIFYLDWYLDPYYQNDLSNIKDDISEVIQNLIIKSSDEEVIEESIHLLSAYLFGPYEVLESHIEDVPEKFKADILYLIKSNS